MPKQSVRLALAIAAAVVALPAHAIVVNTASVSFDNTSGTVTDLEGGGASALSNISLGTSAISQFDSNLGVLTGTTLNLTSTRTQTTHVTSTDGANTGANTSATTSGLGTSTASISAPGVSTTYSSISGSDDCTANRRGSCTGTATATLASPATNDTLAVASNLDSYVGTSTVTVTRRAPTLSAQQLTNVFSGTESTASTVTWKGELSATYEYLLHATPSFDGGALVLELDFGSVFLGDIATLGFSLNNGSGNRVGLDLDSILGEGNLAQLYTDLIGFSDLNAGSSIGFFASLNTSIAGAFWASYTLGMSDADVGASSSRFNYELILNLRGTVIERQANLVPEPGMLALLGVGLLGLGMNRRKLRR